MGTRKTQRSVALCIQVDCDNRTVDNPMRLQFCSKHIEEINYSEWRSEVFAIVNECVTRSDAMRTRNTFNNDALGQSFSGPELIGFVLNISGHEDSLRVSYESGASVLEIAKTFINFILGEQNAQSSPCS